MKLIIGLGNPGEKYINNRHNAGYLFVDYLSENNLTSPQMKAEKTSGVFMNESGRAVRERMDFFKLAPIDLFVVHDDLDLPLGSFKIQTGIGPKIHNGVNSVEQSLGTPDFGRIRIGIDNRDPAHRTPGDQYVLSNFLPEEREKLKQSFAAAAAYLREAGIIPI